MTCILLAVDGSENSGRAADFAAQLAKMMGLDLWLVHVIDHGGLSRAELVEFSQREHLSIADVLEARTDQMLRTVKDRLEEAGGPECHLDVRHGDVTRTILDIAEERDAEAIVVGRRGCGGLAGLVLGSVALKLVCLAARKVVVVP